MTHAHCPPVARVLALTSALALAGCAGAGARSVFPPALLAHEGAAPPVAPDAAARVIERAREYERATGLFSSLVRVDLRDASRGMNLSTRGGVAVDRSRGMLRMQLVGPGGVTAVDLLVRDGSYSLRLAGRSDARGSLDEPPRAGFPVGAVARAFLGFEWARAEVLRALPTLALVRIPQARGGHALLTVDATSGALREARWFESDAEQSRVRFADFRAHGDTPAVPHTVLFWQDAPTVTATITVEQYTPAPALPAQTFEPHPQG